MGWVLFFGILGAFFMLFFMLFTMDPATGEVSAMGIVFSSAAFVLFLWVYLRFHKDDRQIEEKRYSEERAAFYDECIKNGVKSCESERGYGKITKMGQGRNRDGRKRGQSVFARLFAEMRLHERY